MNNIRKVEGGSFASGERKPFVLFCISLFQKREGLKRLLAGAEESENSLTTEPSGRADTSITHGSFCQMLNSKSV